MTEQRTPEVTGAAPVTPDARGSWVHRGAMLTGIGAAAALTSIGSEVGTGALSVSIGEADWHADPIVAHENMFNDPAPDGTSYVMVPIKVTNVAAGEVSPRDEVQLRYLASDGTEYEPERQVVPKDLDEIARLGEGETASGNVLFAIPTEAQSGGTWVVDLGNGTDEAFVIAL